MRFTSAVSALALAGAATAAMPAEEVVTNVDKITQLSSDTNTIAQSISVTNFFTTAPQVINNFKDIISTVTADIAAMNKDSKRSLGRRIDCLNVENPEKCLEDLEEVIEDPSEILGDRKRSLERRIDCLNVENPEKCIEDLEAVLSDPSALLGGRKRSMKKREDTYTDTQQQAICTSFRGFVQVHQTLLATVIGKHGLLSLTPFTQPIAAVLRSLEGVVDTIAFGIIDSVPTCAEDATSQKNDLDKTLKDAEDTYQD